MNYDKMGLTAQTTIDLTTEKLDEWNGSSWVNAIGIAAGFSVVDNGPIPDAEDRANAVALLEKALSMVAAQPQKAWNKITWISPYKVFGSARVAIDKYRAGISITEAELGSMVK